MLAIIFKRFDINNLLDENYYFNNNALNYTQDYLNNSCDGETMENLIQAAFHISIIDFVVITHFYTKNININIETQQILEDFVVLVGDLKAPDVRLTDRAAMGEMLQYPGRTVRSVYGRSPLLYDYFTGKSLP
ncbi:unnamed protein product [Rotaria magnacalcarata]|uniref:Uncharacterized protein n=1 Tax=Rotaria magnacalcarata TaxID=392030 RepID=A0A816WLA2_9BILA|nr:unnamed protein product [Rotaria magnacalcarata]